MRYLYRFCLTALAMATALSAQPAYAHEGAIGDEGPFRVDISQGLPSSIDARWGNGEVEFHVPTGVELVALGINNEPFTKVDAEGNMFGNAKSPTWWVSQDKDVPKTADATAAPEWVWVKGGGSLQYHDHRIHFMAPSLDPALVNGDSVFSFNLPFTVDGAAYTVSGDLVFDATLDPQRAQELQTQGDSTEGSSLPGTALVAVIGIIAAAAGVFAVSARSKSARNKPRR